MKMWLHIHCLHCYKHVLNHLVLLLTSSIRWRKSSLGFHGICQERSSLKHENTPWQNVCSFEQIHSVWMKVPSSALQQRQFGGEIIPVPQRLWRVRYTLCMNLNWFKWSLAAITSTRKEPRISVQSLFSNSPTSASQAARKVPAYF